MSPSQGSKGDRGEEAWTVEISKNREEELKVYITRTGIKRRRRRLHESWSLLSGTLLAWGTRIEETTGSRILQV